MLVRLDFLELLLLATDVLLFGSLVDIDVTLEVLVELFQVRDFFFIAVDCRALSYRVKVKLLVLNVNVLLDLQNV